MSAADQPLTIVGAGTALPTARRSISAWLREVDDCLGETEASSYRGMSALLFDEIGSSVGEQLARIRAGSEFDGSARFGQAIDATQADLACSATAQLFDGETGADRREHCRLTVFTTSGVDENFYQSTASLIASRFGLSRSPHFGLGQLQGASLIAALDVVDSLFESTDPADGATIIAAEKWPTPFPRLLPLPAVLGDGAVALGVSRDPEQPGLRVLGTLVHQVPAFVQPDDTGELDHRALVESAIDVSVRLLDALGIGRDGLSGCLPSGLHPDIDQAVHEGIACDTDFVVVPDSDAGYLAAAATPAMLAELLHRVCAGEFRNGARFLAWALSLTGCVAAMVVQAHTPGAQR